MDDSSLLPRITAPNHFDNGGMEHQHQVMVERSTFIFQIPWENLHLEIRKTKESLPSLNSMWLKHFVERSRLRLNEISAPGK
ncbi:hypothetical protein CCACVL1_16734 [Corchorus capsularis]|uniref:Uncharacterized protein n=1 Tax=Corchorus capsularis TaxID=210143 RepID=A0A1R3HVL8_COCAP|nr:hypothetical protein CCACVL1_16734 [Corchorus capsularis]